MQLSHEAQDTWPEITKEPIKVERNVQGSHPEPNAKPHIRAALKPSSAAH